ncbi:MAG: flippase [Bacteroidota bacterium]
MSTENAAKKYVLNTTWILIEKLSRIVSGILVGILVARYLGPEQFGMISYALNVVAIFTMFSSLGMDSIIVRELITRKEKQNTILGTSFWLRFVGAIAVVIAATYYSSIRDNAQNTYIVFLVSTSVIFQAFTVIDFYFQSAVLGKFSAITQVITLVTSSIVKIVLIYVGARVEYFAAMVLLEAILTVANQLWFYSKNKQNILLWKFSWDEVKELLGHSWPNIVSGLVMTVYQKMDQILVKRFLDLNILGNYAAAVRISEASSFIPVAVCAAILPGIVKNRENKELQLKRLTQLYSLMLWTALIFCVGGLLFGDLVINFLYKEKYYLAAGIFKIHIWNSIPVFYGTAWSMWMLAENKQRYIIMVQFFSMGVALILNLNLIPIYGAKGAAAALITTNFIGMLFTLTFYKPKTSWGLFLKAFNPKNLLEIIKYVKS